MDSKRLSQKNSKQNYSNAHDKSIQIFADKKIQNPLEIELCKRDDLLKSIPSSIFRKTMIHVLGYTGSGKSTLANYLIGCKLENKKTQKGDRIIVSPSSNPPEYFKIGHKNESETSLPTIDGFSTDKVIIDHCGLDDTKGMEMCISNQYLVRNLILKAKKNSIVFVVDYYHLKTCRNIGIKLIISYLKNIFGSIEEIKNNRNSFILIVTQIPNNQSLEMVIGLIEDSDYDNILCGRIQTYDPLNEQDKISKVIKEMKTVELRNTQITIPAEKKEELQKFLEQTISKIEKDYEKFNDQINYRYLFQNLVILCCLDSLENEEIRKMKERFNDRFIQKIIRNHISYIGKLKGTYVVVKFINELNLIISGFNFDLKELKIFLNNQLQQFNEKLELEEKNKKQKFVIDDLENKEREDKRKLSLYEFKVSKLKREKQSERTFYENKYESIMEKKEREKEEKEFERKQSESLALKACESIMPSISEWWVGKIDIQQCAVANAAILGAFTGAFTGAVAGAKLGSVYGPLGALVGGTLRFSVGFTLGYTILGLFCDNSFDEQKEKALSNAYKFLGVDDSSSDQEIDKAFRSLALKYHPDKRGSKDDFDKLVSSRAIIRVSRGYKK